MVDSGGRSDRRPRAGRPRPQRLRAALGLAYTPTQRTVLRGGWGISYVHWQRIGSANLLAINGPQVIRAVVNQTDPTAASFRPTEAGYPAGLTDPSTFNPLTSLVSYIPNDYRSGWCRTGSLGGRADRRGA